MDWLFFALIAPLIYAIVTFVDKYLVESEVSDYNAMPLYMGIVAAVAGTILFFATGMPVLPFRDGFIVMTTGILTAYALVMYFKAMSLEDASNINILFQTFPIFTLILSFIILGERITLLQFVGFVLVLSATIGVSKQKGERLFALTPAFFLILLHNFIWAMSGILMKFALNVSSFAEVISYESFGIAIGAAFLYIGAPSLRKAYHTVTPQLDLRAKASIAVNETLAVVARATTYFAFSLGPVTLVSVLEGTQVFYAIIIGWALTLLFPHIFNEDISRKGLIKKAGYAFMAVAGILLISA